MAIKLPFKTIILLALVVVNISKFVCGFSIYSSFPEKVVDVLIWSFLLVTFPGKLKIYDFK